MNRRIRSVLHRWAWGLGLAVVTGCAGAPVAAPLASSAAPLMGDAWFAARAAALRLDPEAARARDAAFSESRPPEAAPDAQLAGNAAALWTTLCASCHGATGRLEGVPPTPLEAPRPRELGTTGMAMGFFFGGDKMRAGLYRKIAYGQPPSEKPSAMPLWAGTLSREQIWALVAHIESL